MQSHSNHCRGPPLSRSISGPFLSLTPPWLRSIKSIVAGENTFAHRLNISSESPCSRVRTGAYCPCVTEPTFATVVGGYFWPSILRSGCAPSQHSSHPQNCPRMGGSAGLVVGQTIGGLAPAEVTGVHREEQHPPSGGSYWLRVPL